jgi:glucosamine-6-phosphate deaminase
MNRSMRLTILPDPAAVTDHVAQRIADLVAGRSRVCLGLATGETMRPVYDRLAAMNGRGLSFAGVTCFNLDEYAGLGPDHPGSFASYMRTLFYDRVDIREGARHIPVGTGWDDAAATRYELAIRAAGGIDLQILGIGRNGHIGFNEPGSAFTSRTRSVDLAPSTRADNASAFGEIEAVPMRAITMGIATILETRAIVAVATGPAKAEAIRDAIEGPIAAACPASALRLHGRVEVVCDASAAALLQRTGRGREISGDQEPMRCAIS